MMTFVSIAILVGNILITLGFLVLMGRPALESAGSQLNDEKLGLKGVPVIMLGIATTCSPLFFTASV
ncbi:hypothetical protein [Sphingomonas sp. T9W2]|uniref:hypothetical protein n=1 Tax=Sphingomonas sp. T9W2 TaxID=3143183 RepID=UPI0031F592B3